MEAIARFDYETKASDELSFIKGEQLNVVQTSGNWFKAELNGFVGSVAKNFLNIHLPSWYQEDCSRVDAEEQLVKKPVGAFVIRGSRKTDHGDFSISVRLEAAVQHFKVMRDSRGQYYLWSERFSSLNQLVEYYQHTSISKKTKVFLLETGPQQGRGSEDVRPSQRPLPPPPSSSDCPPASAPVAQQQVRALYSFEAEESDELQFNTGDVISVLESSDPTWWRGALRGKSGLFPSNHTTPL
ncbi:GRB2-related adapter protein-like [Trematomus bernacchii]|uniref:GRB2-related adapter protein-like n=1 Tax=Trematomus bernacchii TaxID=40690 RepID=UPI00146EFA6C|nr:GRB2-related adapter protein-like [Trematomus bernacchii]